MHGLVVINLLAFSAQAYAEEQVPVADNLLRRADNVGPRFLADLDATVLAKGAPTQPPTPPPPKNPFASLFGGGGKTVSSKGKGKVTTKGKGKAKGKSQVTVYAPVQGVIPDGGGFTIDGKSPGDAFKDVFFGGGKKDTGKTRALPPTRRVMPLVRGPATPFIRGPPIR